MHLPVADIGTRHWCAGWSHFVPFELEHLPCVLSYREDDGGFAFNAIATGDGVTLRRLGEGRWRRLWTHLMPFTFHGKPCYLSYRANDGTFAFDEIMPIVEHGVLVKVGLRSLL